MPCRVAPTEEHARLEVPRRRTGHPDRKACPKEELQADERSWSHRQRAIVRSGRAISDTLAIGLSPAQSIAMLDAVMAQHAAGMAMFNAVSSQQNAAIVRSAAVTMACTALLSVPLASKAGAVAGAAPGGAAQTSATAPAQTPPTSAPPASDEPTETSKGGFRPRFIHLPHRRREPRPPTEFSHSRDHSTQSTRPRRRSWRRRSCSPAARARPFR